VNLNIGHYILLKWGTIYGIINKQIPLEQLVDPLDQMLKAFAVDEVPMDLHSEISVQMAQEISSAFPSSTSSPCHFEPAQIQNDINFQILLK